MRASHLHPAQCQGLQAPTHRIRGPTNTWSGSGGHQSMEPHPSLQVGGHQVPVKGQGLPRGWTPLRRGGGRPGQHAVPAACRTGLPSGSPASSTQHAHNLGHPGQAAVRPAAGHALVPQSLGLGRPAPHPAQGTLGLPCCQPHEGGQEPEPARAEGVDSQPQSPCEKGEEPKRGLLAGGARTDRQTHTIEGAGEGG